MVQPMTHMGVQQLLDPGYPWRILDYGKAGYLQAPGTTPSTKWPGGPGKPIRPSPPSSYARSAGKCHA